MKAGSRRFRGSPLPRRDVHDRLAGACVPGGVGRAHDDAVLARAGMLQGQIVRLDGRVVETVGGLDGDPVTGVDGVGGVADEAERIGGCERQTDA